MRRLVRDKDEESRRMSRACFYFLLVLDGLSEKGETLNSSLNKDQLYKAKARTFWDLLKKTTKKVIIKQGGWSVTYLITEYNSLGMD